MLSKEKKVGIALMLCAAALLVVAFLCIPVKAPLSLRRGLLIAAGVMAVLSACVMWRRGRRNLKAYPETLSRWTMMRRSGAFDVAVLFLALAVVSAVLWGIGLAGYRQTLYRHAALAAGSGPVPATLEEARQLPDFIEYNFKQDLNLLSGSYASWGGFALIMAAAGGIVLLYLALVSPIVRSDDELRISHGVYRTVGQYAIAILVVLVIIFPIYWMIITSFKTSDELMQTVPTLWPKRFVWENYPNVLNRAPFGRYLVNTLVSTLGIMCGELTIGVLAAYGFSKGNFKGRDGLFMLVLGALMVPIQVTFVPIYVLISRMNAIDTWAGLILPNLVSAYFVFMLRQNFMSVDNSYIEAGKIDGMGRIGTIVYVLCPMCKPTLITVGIISFINGWNSYFWPKMVTKTEASRTIAVGVQQLKNTFAGQEVSNYNEIMAGAVMAIIPIVFLFLFLQKYIMTGMSKAAMK